MLFKVSLGVFATRLGDYTTLHSTLIFSPSPLLSPLLFKSRSWSVCFLCVRILKEAGVERLYGCHYTITAKQGVAGVGPCR